MNKPPNSRVNLDKAIERLFGTGAKYLEARSLIANALVGQFLPDGVAKGGSALKLRYGAFGFRATRDLDTARRGSLEDFEPLMDKRLKEGWHGFTGSVAPGRPAQPRGVPEPYVMRPFEVRLSYNKNRGAPSPSKSATTKSATPTPRNTSFRHKSPTCSPPLGSPPRPQSPSCRFPTKSPKNSTARRNQEATAPMTSSTCN